MHKFLLQYKDFLLYGMNRVRAQKYNDVRKNEFWFKVLDKQYVLFCNGFQVLVVSIRDIENPKFEKELQGIKTGTDYMKFVNLYMSQYSMYKDDRFYSHVCNIKRTLIKDRQLLNELFEWYQFQFDEEFNMIYKPSTNDRSHGVVIYDGVSNCLILQCTGLLYLPFDMKMDKFEIKIDSLLMQYNQLLTLEGLPNNYFGSVVVNNNYISDLKGLPSGCSNLEIFINKYLKSTEGFPSSFTGDIVLGKIFVNKETYIKDLKEYEKRIKFCKNMKQYIIRIKLEE